MTPKQELTKIAEDLQGLADDAKRLARTISARDALVMRADYSFRTVKIRMANIRYKLDLPKR